MEEVFDAVNEKDEIIESAPRSECHKRGLWHRAVAIFVINNKGEILLQKRSKNVEPPGLLCTSASGHLAKGEKYDDAAKRELKEELGIKCKLKRFGKFSLDVVYPDGTYDREHYVMYLCNYDGLLNVKNNEVDFVRFFSIEKIKQMIEENKECFTPGFLQNFSNYIS